MVGVAMPAAGVVAVARLPISAGVSPIVRVNERELPSDAKLTWWSLSARVVE